MNDLKHKILVAKTMLVANIVLLIAIVVALIHEVLP